MIPDAPALLHRFDKVANGKGTLDVMVALPVWYVVDHQHKRFRYRGYSALNIFVISRFECNPPLKRTAGNHYSINRFTDMITTVRYDGKNTLAAKNQMILVDNGYVLTHQ